MKTQRPVWTSKPEHLGRIASEGPTVAARPARIVTGNADIPSLDGVAIVASGQARIVLQLPDAHRLAQELADTLDSFTEDPAVALRRHQGLTDADGELSEPLPATGA